MASRFGAYELLHELKSGGMGMSPAVRRATVGHVPRTSRPYIGEPVESDARLTESAAA